MAVDPFTIAGAGAGLLSSLFGDDGGGTTTQNLNRTETRTPRYKSQTDWYASMLPELLKFNMTKKNPAATPNPISRMVWQAIAQKTGQQPMVDAVNAWKPAEVDPFKFQSYDNYQKEKGIGPYKPKTAQATSAPAADPYGGLPRGLDPSVYSDYLATKNQQWTRRAMGGPVRGNAIMSAMMQQGAKPYIVGDGTGDPNAIEILMQKGDGYVIKNEDVPPAIKGQVAMGMMGPMMRRLGGGPTGYGTKGTGLYQKYDPVKTQAAVDQKAASDYKTYGTGTPPATTPALTYDNSMSQGVKKLATNFMSGGQNVKADPITGAKVGDVANITAPTMTASTVAPVSNITAPTLAPVSDMTASTVNYTPQGMTDRAYLDRVMSDDYLNTDNPFMNSLTASLRADSDAALKDQLAMAGRGDNTYAALRQGRAVGDANRGLTNTIANLLTSDYDKRRALQMQGLGYSTDFDKFTGAQGLEKATADATFGQSAGLANMQKGLDMSKTQGGFDLTASQSNQDAALKAALADAGFAQDASKTNAGLGLEAGQSNQQTALQRALADAGFDQRTGEFNANFGLDAQALNTKNLLSGAGLAGVADNMDWRAIEAMNAVGQGMTNADIAGSDQGAVAESDLILDPKTGKYIKRRASGGFVGGPNASMAFIAELLDKIQGRYGKTRIEGTDATTMPETSPNPIASALSGGMAAYGMFGNPTSTLTDNVSSISNPYGLSTGNSGYFNVNPRFMASGGYVEGRAEGGPVGTIDPFRQALMAAGSRGLQNKGGNLSTILGEMLGSGLDSYNSATDRAFKQRQLEQERERLNILLNETINENKSQKEFRDAQINNMNRPEPARAYSPTTFEDALNFEREKKKIGKEFEEPKQPYKIGQEITRDEGRNKVTYRVEGYGDNNMPILKKIAEGSKDQPLNANFTVSTSYIDANTGRPMVMDRSGNMRPATVVGDATPQIKPSNASVTQESQLNVMKEGLERIKQSWKPSFTGAGQAIVGKAGEWVGLTPEDQTTFYADLASIRDALLRAKSGAQINEQEYKRLANILPSEYKSDRTFKAKLERFEKELNDVMVGRDKAKSGQSTRSLNQGKAGLRSKYGY